MTIKNCLRRPGSLRARKRGFVFARSGAALLSFAALIMLLQTRVARLEGPDVYAIRGAQIVTGTGKNIARGTVVFRNGLITDVGENAKVPADARVIEGAGLTVYPGLIDGYTSLALSAPQRGPSQAGQAAAGQGGQGQQGQADPGLGDPSASAADQVKLDAQGLDDARSAGVTSAYTVPRQGIFAGQGAVINLAGSEPAKLVLRSPVALTVQFTTSPGFFGVFPNSLMGTVSFIRQAFYDGVNYRNQVDRYNRVKRGYPRPEYDKKLAALQPAIKGDMPVIFVANSEGDIRRALLISDEFKLRPIIAGAPYAHRMAQTLKIRKIPVILSVDFPKRPADIVDDNDESLRTLRERAELPTAAAKLAQTGVKFAFTSGSLRPQEFLANVQKAVENGLPKDAALRALTIDAAEILGVADQVGTVEVGKIANLLVTSGDLLAKETRVRHVFIDGSEVDLKKAEAPAQRTGAAGAAAATVDPTGEWSLVIRSPQGDISTTLSLRREGQQISGTFAGPMGSFPVRSVRMSGNQITFSMSIQMGGDTVDATTTGTIEGDSMRGVISLSAMGQFEFTGSRPR
ncbi:MAG TPA: amidohydrolase family protein [Blastocatellia bacterium]|jgi:imidazolonepropionase-like amidohydrolase|nr:amidohydrolase family protein [Blastocatellia bacterium]